MENLNVLNNSGENKVDLTNKVEKAEKSTSKKRNESDYLKIRNRAVNIFKVQLDKSVKTKKASVIEAYSNLKSTDYTLDRFKAEFYENIERLLDSKRFEKACKDSKLIAFNVATHVALDGASKINQVLKNGLKATYPTQLIEMVNPIFTEQELKCATEPESPDCPETTE